LILKINGVNGSILLKQTYPSQLNVKLALQKFRVIGQL